MLYPQLENLLDYIYENYGMKITNIELITNGTIIPSNVLLDFLRDRKIFLRISDYSIEAAYTKQLKKLTQKLEENNNSFYINKDLSWLDFGFPDHPLCIPDDKVMQHMLD